MNYKVTRTATAWDSIGWDNGKFRIQGGTAIYEAVMYNCHNGGNKVKIARLEPVQSLDRSLHVREVARYVSPDTVLEFLEKEQP